MRQANEYLRNGIRGYNVLNGLAEPVIGHNAHVVKRHGVAIARLYEDMPVNDKSTSVQRAYIQFVREVAQQFSFAVEVLGIRYEPTPDNPYKDSAEMCEDVRVNKRLRVYASETNHPFLTHYEQLMFRFIHDLFGHAAEGYEFGPRGEHNAWIHHSMMFGELAQKALTTETRGQNSWVNFGPFSHLPVRERPFATQKVGLLPEWACDWDYSLWYVEED